MEINIFADFRTEVFRLYGEHAYAQVLEILNREGTRFPEEEGRILYWKMCFHSLQGDVQSALQRFTEALEHGHWYGEEWLRSDPDLKPLQGLPEFERLVGENNIKVREAEKNAVPYRLTLETETGTLPHPLLIALHGNTGNARATADYWRPLTRDGWLVALPQSSQRAGSDAFVWDVRDWATREVQHHYHELIPQQGDANRVVIGGFSMGGRLALSLALSGTFPVRGVIALGPAVGDAPDGWRELVANVKNRGVRVYLIIGDQDTDLYQPLLALAELLRTNDIFCETKVYTGMGHVYPPDFAETVRMALEFIMR